MWEAQVTVQNIEWDTEGEDVDLPRNAVLTVEADDDTTESFQNAAVDLLTEKHGWCILGCEAYVDLNTMR